MPELSVRMDSAKREAEKLSEVQNTTGRGEERVIPYGYCHCGCGNLTKLIPENRPKLGLVKGEPNKYLTGHYSNRGFVYKKSHCKRGHERTPENQTSNGSCKICQKLWFENNRRKTKKDWCKKGLHETPEGGKCKECAKIAASKPERKKKKNEREVKRRHKNIEHTNELNRNCYHKQREKELLRLKEKRKTYNKNNIEQISDHYVLTTFKQSLKREFGCSISKSDITPDVIELKRVLIKLKRSKQNASRNLNWRTGKHDEQAMQTSR